MPRVQKLQDLNSSDYVKMRKINDNFYTLTRRKKDWSKKQIAFLESILNYKMFYPIPRSFVREAIFGTKHKDGYYTKDPPKFVLLKNVGLIEIDVNVDVNLIADSFDYYTV